MPRSSVIAAIAAQEAAFSPADVAGLQLWLDASDLSTITESGGSVSQWDDKSGNANHVTQGTALDQPTTGATTKNGLNVLDFDGTNTFLKTSSASTLSQPYTVFILAQHGSGDDRLLSGENLGASFSLIEASNTWFANAGSALSAAATQGTYELISVVVDGASSSLFVTGATADTGDLGSSNFDLITVGGRSDGALAWNGQIAEVLIYDSALSTADREALELYMAAKWGITLS